MYYTGVTYHYVDARVMLLSVKARENFKWVVNLCVAQSAVKNMGIQLSEDTAQISLVKGERYI